MSSSINRPPCPSCGSHDVEVDPDTVSAENAKWACRQCGKRFGKPDYEALSLFFNDDDVPEYVEAHKASMDNFSDLQKSKQCGCFYCVRIFTPSEIDEWICDPGREHTALCPFCGVDAVIGDASGYALTEDLLRKMQTFWF